MKKKFFLSFFIALISFSIIFTAIYFKVIKGGNTYYNIKAPNIIGSDLGEGNEIEQVVKNELVFLLAGVDAKDVKKSKGTRTDTMMIMKVNFDTGGIRIISIPRDTKVDIKLKPPKINGAHAVGGMAGTIKALRELLNIDLDYYVKVDYQIVMDMVDAIGGVTIDVPINMKYDDVTKGFPDLHINIKKGERLLDGKNAHDFLRFRKNNDGSGYAEGDVGRVKAQQYFMKELVKQTLKPKNIIKLPSLAETYFSNVETNIPWNIILQGTKLITKIDPEKMDSSILPGEPLYIGDVSFFIHDKAETKKLMKEEFSDYLLTN